MRPLGLLQARYLTADELGKLGHGADVRIEAVEYLGQVRLQNFPEIAERCPGLVGYLHEAQARCPVHGRCVVFRHAGPHFNNGPGPAGSCSPALKWIKVSDYCDFLSPIRSD